MKVSLMDFDIIKRRKPFPNLALMKLSAYHKARGDEVYLNFPLRQPDIEYVSCVFTWNAKRRATVPDGAIIGGSGINLSSELPPEVEHTKPDYSLYPNEIIDLWGSMGFTSRGCNRSCPWCIVPEKEGRIRASASVYEFLDRRFKKITLLDNNLLASPLWRQTFADLMNIGLEVDFNQGLDIRLVDEEVAWCLSRLKTNELRFAFDDIAYEPAIRKGVEILNKQGIRSRRLSFYFLSGFKEDDAVLERLGVLHDLNVDIYPMLYKGFDGKEPKRRILKVPDLMWHGSRRNINKFLRSVGRLPE